MKYSDAYFINDANIRCSSSVEWTRYYEHSIKLIASFVSGMQRDLGTAKIFNWRILAWLGARGLAYWCANFYRRLSSSRLGANLPNCALPDSASLMRYLRTNARYRVLYSVPCHVSRPAELTPMKVFGTQKYLTSTFLCTKNKILFFKMKTVLILIVAYENIFFRKNVFTCEVTIKQHIIHVT